MGQWLVRADKPTDPGMVESLPHLVLRGVLAHGPHHAQQLLGRDSSTTILKGRVIVKIKYFI